MLFLDDFLEMLDELPAELRERCTEMRQIDVQVEAGLAQNRQALVEFFDCGGQLTEEQKQARYQQLQKEYERLRLLGEMKVTLAERMQEVLVSYMQYLDKEKTHFKYELEADNPGITEIIETRFANYCESLIALRKERKRRLVNGSAENNGEPQSKMSKASNDSGTLSNIIRTEFTLGDDESESPMVSGAGPIRSRKTPVDEFNVARRRSTSVAALKTSLSVPSVMNTNAVSPAVSEKSWTPLSSLPTLEELPSSNALTPSTATSNAQLTPTAPTTMPTFVGPESRHGRPRKLTSRVQEMFKEAVQRQRHHYHRSIDATHITDISTEEDEEVSEEDSDEADDSKRKWCFCNEKSYGDMVACDNKACPYQWFHYPCVNISSTPKGRWYCPHCVDERSRRSEPREFGSASAATTAVL